MALERSRERPQSSTHGLGVGPGQSIDLNGSIAEFVGAWDVDTWDVNGWDVDRTTGETVEIFDRS